ncbi:MAG: TolC family protein [Candidatus Omnitrophica bacterium]|nr:TolC family protein [Candidatus Omnitrophota bacterium]
MRWVLVIGGLVCALPVASAEPPPAVHTVGSVEPTAPTSLSELVGQALARSPQLAAKRRAYEAARGRVLAAWLPQDPEVGVDVEGQSSLLRFDRTDNEYTVAQTIPFPLKLFLRGRIASKEVQIAYQRYKEEERDVVWHIEQPFYEFYVAQKTLGVLEEIRMVVERLLRAAQARYEANAAPQADILKAQIELSKLSIDRVNWEQKMRLAEAHFSHVIDRPLTTRYTLAEEPPSTPPGLSLEELEQLALARRPELKAMELAVGRARQGRWLAAAAWLPDLTGRIEARQFSGEGSLREYDTFLGVTVPVWSLVKGAGGEWRSARREFEEAEADYRAAKNEVLLAVHEAHAKLDAAQHAVETYEQITLPQAKQQVEVALAAYEAGRADSLALVDAERMLREIQMSYYAARGDRELALASLRRTVGSELTAESREPAKRGDR